MTDITEVIVYRAGLRGAGLKYLIAEVEGVTTSDTVTIGEMTEIKAAACIRIDTGSLCTVTTATNVVTVTGAVTNAPLVLIVSGW
jgi:uncharacterized integral membrane protein